MICSLCPHRCRAARTPEKGFGVCGLPNAVYAARAYPHFGEEPCISGTRGSGAVFFSGCTLSCVYCQNREISRSPAGAKMTPQSLAECFRMLVQKGVHNINLVSPTPYVPLILQALRLYRPPVALVYNCGGYERVETLRALEGWIDIYLPDMKYGDDHLALSLSGAEHYRETALAAIAEMLRQTDALRTDASGIAVRGTLVRHLVLPGHLANTEAVLRLLAGRFSPSLWVSLLFQYTPMLPQERKELGRALTRRECDKAFEMLCSMGFENGYVQDYGSCGTDAIPRFDLTGISHN